ncbi:MAG TPA: hypothetical protein VMR81_05915 [Patescibacteria group bacterium]|jgi:hypothetical protein|nr:hypothetical protein [Patescibacteria group bacterium]
MEKPIQTNITDRGLLSVDLLTYILTRRPGRGLHQLFAPDIPIGEQLAQSYLLTGPEGLPEPMTTKAEEQRKTLNMTREEAKNRFDAQLAKVGITRDTFLGWTESVANKIQ